MGVMTTLNEWGKALAEQSDWQKARQKFEAQYKAAAAMKHAGQMRQALNGLLPVYENLREADRAERVRRQLEVKNSKYVDEEM